MGTPRSRKRQPIWLVMVAVALTLPGADLRSVSAHQEDTRATLEDRAFSFRLITDGVYLAMGTEWLATGGNVPVIVNADDVLLVDALATPDAAVKLQRELLDITTRPIRYVVDTHFHVDHANGNQSFAFPVEIIGHEFTGQMLRSGMGRTGRAYDYYGSLVGQRIAQLNAQLRSVTNVDQRSSLERRLAALEYYRLATGSVVPTPPIITVRDGMIIHRGRREIRLLFLGRGHTGGDLVVYLPSERIVMTGDLLGPTPMYLGDAYPTEWVDALERLRSLDFETVLPAHGAPFQGKERIDAFQNYLRDFWSRARRFHDEGVAAEEAAKRIDMRDHTNAYPAIKAPGVAVDGVLRAYELLDGKVR